MPLPPSTPPDESLSSTVEVVGPLHLARFPELCVQCGRPASRTLRITRLFRRSRIRQGRRQVESILETVEAPCCEECLQVHERERTPIGEDVKKRLLRSWMIQALPFLLPLGVCLWILGFVLPGMLRGLGGEGLALLLGLGIAGFFAAMTAAFLYLILKPGRHLIHDSSEGYVQIEAGPLGSRFIVAAPPTSLMGSIDFTDDCSELFEGERHRFTFRNGLVAAHFAHLNGDRTWNPAAPRARVAAYLRWALVLAVLLVGLYYMVVDALR